MPENAREEHAGGEGGGGGCGWGGREAGWGGGVVGLGRGEEVFGRNDMCKLRGPADRTIALQYMQIVIAQKLKFNRLAVARA